MSIYTSQGTIRVHCSLSNCGSGMTFFFVPDNDYSIKHGNKTFAVFVPKSCSCTPQSCNKAIIRIYDRDKGNGVEIRAAESGCPENTKSGCPEIISDAAVHQKKVGVWVEEVNVNGSKQYPDLKITGITVPSK